MNDVDFGGASKFDGYGPGFFRVGGEVRQGAVLVHRGGVQAWNGGPEAIVALSDLLDVLLYGAGEETAHAPEELTEALERVGIGVESMASPTACRTYNVLLGEGRRVGAAVLPVGGVESDATRPG